LKRSFIGIDIRPDSVAAVKIEAGFRRAALADWTTVSLGAAEEEEAPYTDALSRIDARLGLAGQVCIVGLPSAWVCFRLIPAPFQNERKIEQVLPFELETCLPFPVEDYRFGFRLLAARVHRGQPTVFAAGLPAAQLAAVQRAFKTLNTTPAAVTIGSLAKAAWLAGYNGPASNGLLLDGDPAGTTLHFIRQNEIIASRFVALDGALDDQRVTLDNAVAATTAALEDQHFFRPEATPVWRAGTEQPPRGRTRDEADDTSLDIRALAGLDLPSPPTAAWEPSRLDAALALALCEAEGRPLVWLHRRRFSAARPWANHKKALIRCGVLAAAGLLLLLGNVGVTYHRKQTRLAQLNLAAADILRTQFPDATRIVDPVSQMKSRLKNLQQNSGLGLMDGDGPSKIDIVAAMSRNVGPEIRVTLSRLVIGDQTVSLAGVIDDFNQVNTMKTQLERVPYFGSVVIEAANIDQTTRQVRFQITAELKS
jgi:hypothetical protein